ncbi:MAG: monovalent cation/H+ antiporter complex subunit F [Puniceicoccales bacterium]
MPFGDFPFPLGIAMVLAAIFYVAALVLALIRVIRGPTAFDRIVALDLIAALCLGVIVLFAIHFDQQVFVDAAFIIALVGFLGTVAFSRFLERDGGDRG